MSRVETKGGSRRGYVYFAAASNSDLIKIGFTSRPGNRFHGLKVATLGDVSVAAMFPGTIADEKAEHQRFAGQREFGEWFRSSADLTARMAEIGMPDTLADAAVAPDEWTATARRRAIALEIAEADRQRIPRSAARLVVADRAGLLPGFLESLINRRIHEITARAYFALHAETVAENLRRTAEVEASLANLRSGHLATANGPPSGGAAEG